ncbi:DegQ family serine endoprotease [Leeia oryzae]|uniref:DegQ family serine endoprotease n=1 Tax=Leeia oryzae TaxID=356662 RepID=UPI00039E232E|nr:DegQ family serine endoprotease [Leeia oryzae]
MEKDTRPTSKTWLGGLVLVAAGAGAGYLFHASSQANALPAQTTVTTSVASLHNAASMLLPDFTKIVAEQGPAVVNVSVSGTVKASDTDNNPFADGDPFGELFKRFQLPSPEQRTPVHGLGSGFIVKDNGIVLTNAHVVADADEVIVKLTDKREFKAKVLGVDKLSDVAVLKIPATHLPTVKLGDTANVRTGEWVAAIGAPFGFENSVTAGIVSAKSRSLPDEGYVPFLQTDVAINPGNSGGPLFNLNGEVIGINSQIYSRSGGYQGLSFAIPIDVAMKVEQQLVNTGKVSRGKLGVTIQPVTQELAKSFGLPAPEGALVRSVEKDSPAERAGLEAGDIILKFNGSKIDQSEQLPVLVAGTAPNSSATLSVWHQGKEKQLTLKVGELKTQTAAAEAAPTSKLKLGLMLRPLSPQESKEAGTRDGLVVEDVTNGPAARAGITPGDIILSVNGVKTASVDDLKAEMDKRKGHLALQIKRGEEVLFVPVNVG